MRVEGAGGAHQLGLPARDARPRQPVGGRRLEDRGPAAILGDAGVPHAVLAADAYDRRIARPSRRRRRPAWSGRAPRAPRAAVERQQRRRERQLGGGAASGGLERAARRRAQRAWSPSDAAVELGVGVPRRRRRRAVRHEAQPAERVERRRAQRRDQAGLVDERLEPGRVVARACAGARRDRERQQRAQRRQDQQPGTASAPRMCAWTAHRPSRAAISSRGRARWRCSCATD